MPWKTSGFTSSRGHGVPQSLCDAAFALAEACERLVARRLIGAKRLAPSELLASCIGRIEAVDHAVNAMVARDFDRARASAKAADAAVARGDPLGPLHGLPIGIGLAPSGPRNVIEWSFPT